MKIRIFFAVAASLFLLAVMNVSGSRAQSAAEILQQINQFRANNGLPPLQYNSALAAAAQDQANYMAEFQVFSSHIGYGGSTPLSRARAAGYNGRVSENIVGGTGMSAADGLRWWINSPIHYRTLITTQYTEAGTGFATDGNINYYVLVVGQPGSAPPPANSPPANPAPLFVTPITLAEPAEDGSITHIVQEGQALWTLAAYYDVPLSDLLLYNNLKEDAFVQPGDEIIIRLADGQPPPPTPTPPTTHIVQKGQSLWSIAALYDVKIGEIMLYNNLTENSILKPGDEIKIRLLPGETPPPTPTPPLKHVVQAGQTLWDIALTYNLDLNGLLALNEGLTADSIIMPGDELWVRPAPAAPAATPPPPTATAAILPTLPGLTPTPPAPPTAVPLTLASAAGSPAPTATAAATAATTVRPQTAVARLNPLVGGIVLLVVGLLALGGAGILALRRNY